LYKLEFLPSARQDMVEIVRYISKELHNPAAADRLANNFLEAADRAAAFPYAAPGYHPIRPLKHEYRKLVIQNYLMFYWVDEQEKVVTVAYVTYAKRDYERNYLTRL
jgi:toxin ParE1/3/4